MSSPLVSTNFGDLLDPLMQRIFNETLDQLPDMVATVYNIEPTNGRNNMQFSQVGAAPDFEQFTGTVSYNSVSQGYDTTLTPLEFTNGIQVERKLADDDQHNVISSKPRSLARSAHRTRQKHAARVFNNAFTVDSLFYANTEGVAMCSNSHTTTSGASTASGFDNLGTAPLTATAVAAARIQMVGFRGDQAERVNIMPDELWYPPNLYEVAEEIVRSTGKVDSANNNSNVHENAYERHEWQYLTDTNNWWLGDSSMRKKALFWTDRIPLEFAMVEDMDTLVAKWRAYMRYAAGHVEWRWCMGHQVT